MKGPIAEALTELEAELERTWNVIGGRPEDDADPEVLTLDGAVRVSLEYERDLRQVAEDNERIARGECEVLRAEVTRLNAKLDHVERIQLEIKAALDDGVIRRTVTDWGEEERKRK